MPRRPLQEASRPIVRGQEMGWERAWRGQGARGGFGLATSGRIPVASAGQIDAGYCLRFLRRIRDCSFATVDAEGLPAVRVIDVMHVEDGRLFFLASCVLKTGRSGSTRGHACVAGCAKRRVRTARYFGPQGARMAGRERIGHPRGVRRFPRIGREDLP